MLRVFERMPADARAAHEDERPAALALKVVDADE